MSARQICESNMQTILLAMQRAGVLGLALKTSGYNDEGDINDMALVAADGRIPGEMSYHWNQEKRCNVVTPASGVHAIPVRVMMTGNPQWPTIFPYEDNELKPMVTKDVPLSELAHSLASHIFERDESGYGCGEDRVEDTFVITFDVPADSLHCTRTTDAADTIEEAVEIVNGSRPFTKPNTSYYVRMGWR